ncbi:glycerate kinase [Curvibacter sp. HBC61]|uniref:Glycerate kinase n=1 Tax=Curvibacter cyanobacteriorum TaxID=3026422 RepID=A0ABT5N284_9BURK|nr:glycerate kinase [Curvibacter sp. HBC61]MDD0840370.1 glycerate kinase [Curvibacter sp. HBC61]
MNFKKILVPVGGLLIVGLAYRAYGLAGVAAALGGVVMWVLMHYTRLMQVLKRANNNPIGYVGSAVMLNAKLRPGVPLIHVLALTRALGELQSPEGEQPEVYRWTDGTRSHVTAEFRDGKLVQWTLVRPPAEDAEAPPTP